MAVLSCPRAAALLALVAMVNGAVVPNAASGHAHSTAPAGTSSKAHSGPSGTTSKAHAGATSGTSTKASSAAPSGTSIVKVPAAVPSGAGAKLLPGFVAFSIEQQWMPNFSGTKGKPNEFTMNLMSNLGDLQGVPPPIRSGGDTQDETFYDANAKYDTTNGALAGIGPSFFDGFNNWPKGTQLSFGFNLKNTSANAQKNLAEMAAAACKGIEKPNLSYWELGNEPNHYGIKNMADYVKRWNAGAKAIQDAVAKACPSYSSVGFLGPSFSAPGGQFNEAAAFEGGLDPEKKIKMISCHNYIGGAKDPGISLQKTLLNHQTTVESVKGQTDLASDLRKSRPDTPFIIGEGNSLAGGAKGLSNVFGGAIWTVDFSLRAASQSIGRIHFHQSEGAAYSAWNPIQDKAGKPETLAPYYGHMAVAAFIGKEKGVQVVDFPQKDPQMSVYGAYVDGQLKRMAVLNMHEFTSTTEGKRPSANVDLDVTGSKVKTASVQRLQAAGAEVTSKVTFGGKAYDFATQGKPAAAGKNGAETITVKNGAISVPMPNSEVAILSLE